MHSCIKGKNKIKLTEVGIELWILKNKTLGYSLKKNLPNPKKYLVLKRNITINHAQEKRSRRNWII